MMFISKIPKRLSIFILGLSTLIPVVKGNSCSEDDPIACREGPHECFVGEKVYDPIFPHVFDSNKRGMYCDCGESTEPGYSGFTDVHCYTRYTVCPDSSVCLNGGVCQETTAFGSSSSYSCLCTQDSATGKLFAGSSCEFEVKDQGICKETNAYTEVNGGKWYCANGGICDDKDSNLGSKCNCSRENGMPLFYGLHCEFPEEYHAQPPPCTLDCKNGGICRNGVKDYSTLGDNGLNVNEYLGESSDQHCVCPDGFAGQTCEAENIVSCGKEGFCFNGQDCLTIKNLKGNIISHECMCDYDFGGRYCEILNDDIRDCPAPKDHDPRAYYCAHGGSCGVEPYMPCTDCDEGYFGPRCEMHSDESEADYNEHCDLDCKNGGLCYFGEAPVTSEFDDLDGFELTINNRHCRCPEGYTGTYCEMKVNICGSGEHFCLQEGSTCVKNNDEYTCNCETALESYAGSYCQHIATEFCTPANKFGKVNSFCTNDGVCREYLDEYNIDHVGCICEDGYTGDFCEHFPQNTKFIGKLFISIFIIGVIVTLVYTVVNGRRRHGNPMYGNNNQQFFPVSQVSSRDGTDQLREMS